MKRLLIIIALVLIWAGPVWGATETFYVCAGGDGTLPETDACATAYDISDLNTAANWDSDDQNDGKIGPNDDVLFKDDGGAFRAQLTVQKNGLSGKHITLKNYAGDSPEIFGSVLKDDTAWILWYTSGEGTSSPVCNSAGERCIYRIYDATNFVDYIYNGFRSTDGGTTWTRARYPTISYMKNITTAQIQDVNIVDDEMFIYDRGTAYVYFRCDYDTCADVTANVGDFEIPVASREYGINIQSYDFITIDGLTFRFQGANTSGNHNNPAGIATWSVHDITVQNCEFGPLWNRAYREYTNTVVKYNIAFNYNYVHDAGSGFRGAGGCWNGSAWEHCLVNNEHDYEYGSHFGRTNYDYEFIGNYFDQIGTVTGDRGYDFESVGLQSVDGVVIEKNFFGETMPGDGHSTDEDYMHENDNVVTLLWGRDSTVRYNYFYRCGQTCITSWGAGSTQINEQDTTIHHNVFDSWGYNLPTHDGQSHCVGDQDPSYFGTTANEKCTGSGTGTGLYIQKTPAINFDGGQWPDANTADTANGSDTTGDADRGSALVYNNLFINGPNLLGGGYTGFSPNTAAQHTYATVGFNWHKWTAIELYDNVFHDDRSLYAIYMRFHSTTAKSTVKIENNYIWATTGNESITYDDGTEYTWAHNKLIGDADTFWDWEWVNERGFTSGNNDDNADADPELASTTAGPENDKSPLSTSVLNGAAFNSETALDGTTDFTDVPPTIVTIVSDEIGPYNQQPSGTPANVSKLE
jgi:hypothetical protein